MDSYFSHWTNRPANASWIEQAFSPYDILEQQQQQPPPNKELASKSVLTALDGRDEDLNDDEAEYMFRELKSLSLVQLVNKIRDIQNMTYELGVNESLEMSRAKLLRIFDHDEDEQQRFFAR